MPLLTVAYAAYLAICLVKAFRFRVVLRVSKLERRREDLLGIHWVPDMDCLLVIRGKAPCIWIVDYVSCHFLVLHILYYRALAEVQAQLISMQPLKLIWIRPLRLTQ